MSEPEQNHESPRTPGDLPRRIGFWGASGIMVGIIIGSGIFRTPTEIAEKISDPWLILALWAAGGLLSLFGALSYAELGAMFPHSGGIYVFLREGYGRCIAFVFGWTYMLITKPLAAAAIAVVLAEHVNALLGVAWDPRILTCVTLILLTAVNTVKVTFGAGIAILLTFLKVAALLGIVLLGVALAPPAASATGGATPRVPLWAALAPVMAAILWTYDGWSDVAIIAGEIKRPQVNLPRVLFTGTLAVIALYLAVNAVYFRMVPLEEMRTLDTVAPVVTRRLIGSAGGVIVTIMIIVATLGSTHGSIITGARITFAQARDGLLFRFLSHVHPRFQTPDASLWFQCLLSCLAAMFVQTFERLTNGFIFTMWIFYGMAAAGVIILRIRRPDLHRPYRCWGYPFVPLLFVAGAAFMTDLTLRQLPWTQTLPWLGVLLAGVPAYFAWMRLQQRSALSHP